VADRDARLADFLANPRETREVELKRWLDLSEPENRGKVARHLMALANYGGGWLQFGFAEQPDGSFTHEGIACPESSRYSTDAINEIVARHASPRFHCESFWEECEEGCTGAHALIRIPGGHKVPIVCARGGPDPGNNPRKGATYDRLPGPESSPISEANDWHELFERCLRARRDELVANVQTAIELLGPGGLAHALQGGESLHATNDRQEEKLDREPLATMLEKWVEESEARLREHLAEPDEDSDLYSDGSWSFAYSVDPPPTPAVDLGALREILWEVVGRETGWPAWWWPTIDDERSPHPVGDAIECWMRGGTFRDAAHADFWRASGHGQLYLLRGYDEDSAAEHPTAHSNLKPGVMLDPVIVIWRVGECLLHAERMARRLNADSVQVDICWYGLKDRVMGTLEPLRRVFDSGPCQQETVHSAMVIKADVISGTLADLVRKLTAPLFIQFNFFEMRIEDIERELDRMRGRTAE
jgi:hypothetical protein